MPDLSQSEASRLLAVEKVRVDSVQYDFPDPGERLTVAVSSVDAADHFLLDILRGRIRPTKATFQLRVQRIVVLARLDVDGPQHPNPDGEVVPCPHMHLYRPGYGTKWAYPPPHECFSNLADLMQTWTDFMTWLRVTSHPLFRPRLSI